MRVTILLTDSRNISIVNNLDVSIKVNSIIPMIGHLIFVFSIAKDYVIKYFIKTLTLFLIVFYVISLRKGDRNVYLRFNRLIAHITLPKHNIEYNLWFHANILLIKNPQLFSSNKQTHRYSSSTIFLFKSFLIFNISDIP